MTYAVSHAVQPASGFTTALSTCHSTPIASQVPNAATSHPAHDSTHFYQTLQCPKEGMPLSHRSNLMMDLLPNPVAAYLTSRTSTCRASSRKRSDMTNNERHACRAVHRRRRRPLRHQARHLQVHPGAFTLSCLLLILLFLLVIASVILQLLGWSACAMSC